MIAVYNQLGETNVVSERIEEKIYIKFEAVPTIPDWIERKDISINDAFDIQSIGDYIRANVGDKKEIITYLIQIPEERNDLIFSDSQVILLVNQQKWCHYDIRGMGRSYIAEQRIYSNTS